MKEENIPDIMDVIVGDYSVIQLYGHILNSFEMQKEIENETRAYIEFVDQFIEKDKIENAEQVIQIVLNLYPTFVPLYLQNIEILWNKGLKESAFDLFKKMYINCTLPPDLNPKLEGIKSRLWPDN